MKNKIDKKYSFVLMIIIFISFTLLFNTYISKKEDISDKLTSVIALEQNIEANTTINNEMLVYKTVNEEEFTEDMYINPDDVLGMKTLVPLYKGEIVNKNRISDSATDIINKDFAVKIDVTDKALNLVPGIFIDIWKVPTKEGFETGLEPEIMFTGEYIIDVKNEAYVSYKDYKVKKDDSSEGGIFTPDYVVLNLSDMKMKTINNINGKFYTLRMTLHKDNSYYENLQNIQQKNSDDEKVLEEKVITKETSELAPKKTEMAKSTEIIEEGVVENEDN